MDLTVKFSMDNASFEGDAMRPEAAEVFRGVAYDLEANDWECGAIHDSNGNTIGSWEVSE